MAHLESKNKKSLDYAFYPASVAIVGASDQQLSFGYHFLRHLLDYEFSGKIYPVNPSKENILGVKSYPSLSSIPGDVDMVICCVPANKVIDLLDECPAKNVKIMHLFTARLGETGRPQAAELEKEIERKADKLGIPIIGPNCMGVYSPKSGISFGYGFPREAGDIGVVFQSGGAATLLIQNGMLQGLRFSKAVSYGNAMNIDESDLLDYFAADDETKVVAMYVEGVKNGKRLIHSLKKAAAKKPVLVIKGGKGNSGTRAVLSHTAALAGSQNLWVTLFRQCGAIEVDSIEEMIDLLALFKHLPHVSGNNIAMMGGGGGKGVISADIAERAGFTLPPLPADMRERLKEIVPDLWDWLGNPIDFSIWGDSAFKAEALPILFGESSVFDVIVLQASDENPLSDEWWARIVEMEVNNMIAASRTGKKPVIAVLSGAKPGAKDLSNVRWQTIFKQKSRLLEAGVPTFDTVAEAVKALHKFTEYWSRR